MSWQTYKRALKYITCFTTGFAILVLELIAFRLLAPYFGVSNIVTGIIINAILLALATGYLFGGYCADKFKSEPFPYLVILFASLYLMVIYVLYTPLMHVLADQAVVLGATLTMIIMFFIPTVLLAFIPPYFIRTISLHDTVGKTAGLIYALSTLGSIFGGILTTFLFIPFLGSQATFMLAIIVLLSVLTLGLISFNMNAVFLMALAIPLLFQPALKLGKVVYQGESEYNVITIKQSAGGDDLYLLLNDGKGHHSKSLNRDTMLSNDYYDDFLIAQLLSATEHTLILGNGAGTSMQQASYFFNNYVDGVEIDHKLTLIGQEYFGLILNNKLKIYHQDARTFLNRNQQKYDTILVDVYAGSPFIPFHVATLEFYKQVKKSLTTDGIVAVNIPFYSINTELYEYFINTIERIFPGNVYMTGCVAFVFQTDVILQELTDRITSKAMPAALKEHGHKVISELKKVTTTNVNKVFTDNLAPIENMTQHILKNGLPAYTNCRH